MEVVIAFVPDPQPIFTALQELFKTGKTVVPEADFRTYAFIGEPPSKDCLRARVASLCVPIMVGAMTISATYPGYLEGRGLLALEILRQRSSKWN